MKTISLLLPLNYKLSSVASILEVFETVNTLCEEQGKEKPFKIQLLCLPEYIQTHGKDFFAYPLKSIYANIKSDTVLLPSFTTSNLKSTVAENHLFIPWIQKQYKAGADIASFCTGAYLFAATGLLDRKLATTHVDACANFVIDYPLVFVKPGRTLTVDGRCYTSGGSTSSFHLLVFLIQKYIGHEMALRISKIFAIELDRHQQSYFSTFRPDHSHNDDMVKKIQQKIEAGYLHINTIEEVIKDLPASRRNIARRFKLLTGLPPIEYLQNIRVEAAKKLLEQTDLSMSEIIPGTGYTDPKSFRKVFLKLVGLTPLEYRDKFKIR